MTRRELFTQTLALGAGTVSTSAIFSPRKILAAPAVPVPVRNVAVVGAGVFGLWSAYTLQRAGLRVTLLDAFGAGNIRSSSNDETRMIRVGYGNSDIYTRMAARSTDLWKETQTRLRKELFVQSGCLWLMGDDEKYFRLSIPYLNNLNVPYEEWKPEELSKKYPNIALQDISKAFFEPNAGYLLARRSCDAILEAFIAEGGEYKPLAAKLKIIRAGEIEQIQLSDGSMLRAEQFVFACGAWLGEIFPDALGDVIHPTRQEVFYFGVGYDDKKINKLPAWVDMTGKALMYGIPGAGADTRSSGFKVADDTRPGGVFNPTSGDRLPSDDGVKAARRFMAQRFPDMQNAPLIHAKVCQYENSVDGDFIIDRLPEAKNAIVVGGGSGHGFKHAPAIGELVAGMLMQGKETPKTFALKRFPGK
jgi:glycine/D-amino acid oxidase-like deaminating enzyme